MKTAAVVSAALLALGLVPACTSDEVADPTAAVEVDVTSSNTFSPSTVTVKVGQTVRWVWKGGSHNVVSGTGCAEDGKFKSGATQAGGTWDHTFETAGTFAYYCEPHCGAGMTGTVVVTN